MERTRYETEFGDGWIMADGGEVIAIHLPGTAAPAAADAADPPPTILSLATGLEAYFAGGACLVVDSRLLDRAGGGSFHRAVYRVVAAIPPGATSTYGEVAAAAGRPHAARAVGAAMARNPFPPLIPCHRVVGGDGRLRGYGGGLAMKEHLLEMERRQ